MLSVRPSVSLSVCDVEVSWSYKLEVLISLSFLLSAEPNNPGYTPKETPPNFSRNRSWVSKNWLYIGVQNGQYLRNGLIE